MARVVGWAQLKFPRPGEQPGLDSPRPRLGVVSWWGAAMHDDTCACDTCWPVPRCRCGARPHYHTGPERVPLCVPCYDYAKHLEHGLVVELGVRRREIVAPGALYPELRADRVF